MKPNLTRQYAHEVVTAAMHNEVCNLSMAQRARDQAEIIREQRDGLLAALDCLLQSVEGQRVTMGDCNQAHAAIARAKE